MVLFKYIKMVKKRDELIIISKEDKKKLDGLKIHPRETYKEVIHKLLMGDEKNT